MKVLTGLEIIQTNMIVNEKSLFKQLNIKEIGRIKDLQAQGTMRYAVLLV